MIKFVCKQSNCILIYVGANKFRQNGIIKSKYFCKLFSDPGPNKFLRIKKFIMFEKIRINALVEILTLT